MVSEELHEECAAWVAEQLAEENILVDPELVSLILEAERTLGAASAASHATAAAVESALAARGVRGAPNPIDAALIYGVLQWEDEFMALAGLPRPE